VHLHTLPGQPGGVVNVFNLTDQEQSYEVTIPAAKLGGTNLPVAGAHSRWTGDGVTFWLILPAMCPAVVRIGAVDFRQTGVDQRFERLTRSPLPLIASAIGTSTGCFRTGLSLKISPIASDHQVRRISPISGWRVTRATRASS